MNYINGVFECAREHGTHKAKDANYSFEENWEALCGNWISWILCQPTRRPTAIFLLFRASICKSIGARKSCHLLTCQWANNSELKHEIRLCYAVHSYSFVTDRQVFHARPSTHTRILPAGHVNHVKNFIVPLSIVFQHICTHTHTHTYTNGHIYDIKAAHTFMLYKCNVSWAKNDYMLLTPQWQKAIVSSWIHTYI